MTEKQRPNQKISGELSREVKLRLLKLKDEIKQLRQYDCYRLENSEGELIVLTKPITRAPLEKLLGEYQSWLDGKDKSLLSRIWHHAPLLIETELIDIISCERVTSVKRPLINILAHKYDIDVRRFSAKELLTSLKLARDSLPEGKELEDMNAVLSVLEETPELVVMDRETTTQTLFTHRTEAGAQSLRMNSGIVAYHPEKGCRMIEPYQRRKKKEKDYGESVPGMPRAYFL